MTIYNFSRHHNIRVIAVLMRWRTTAPNYYASQRKPKPLTDEALNHHPLPLLLQVVIYPKTVPSSVDLIRINKTRITFLLPRL